MSDHIDIPDSIRSQPRPPKPPMLKIDKGKALSPRSKQEPQNSPPSVKDL